MPRKDFIHDLQAAASSEYVGLASVGPGEDDGTISCRFNPDGDNGNPVDIQFLISDLSDYPQTHEYFLYTTSDDVPNWVATCLERVQPRLRGRRVTDMLSHLSNVLNKTGSLKKGEKAASAFDYDEELANDLEMDDADVDEDFDNGWSPNSPFLANSNLDTLRDNELKAESYPYLLQRLSADLRAAKLAGFRVGYLGNEVNPVVCISCRISRLGISEEAMQAWQVSGKQYLICLVRYIGRYRSLEEIIQEDATLGKASVELLVDLCDSYKPTLESALSAMSEHRKNFENSSISEFEADHSTTSPRKIIRSFISKPLNSLMNDRFVKILCYRHMYGLSWEGAELFFNDIQGKSLDHADPRDQKYLTEERETSTDIAVPRFVTADHFFEKDGFDASFPLIAMQFTLRHFVRCTEFCLVCHCKTNDAFEALKPYVCSKHLCLYQYMALGFGPSLEWEILSQPDVVDLLVSFTYCSAANGRLKDFPIGLGFLVPSDLVGSLPKRNAYQAFGLPAPSSSASKKTKALESGNQLQAKLNRLTMELLLHNDYGDRFLRPGDWIVITNYDGNITQLHCRIQETSLWPTVQLDPPIPIPNLPEDQMSTDVLSYKNVDFVVYDKNFDELTESHRRATICLLLETLPPVDEMKAYLSSFPSASQPTLSNWKDRISKSALDVLRWIVASNRSCIIQDDPETVSTSEIASEARGIKDHRVGGVNGYMQFRFAQGAPDKEQRFIQSVATSSDAPKFPTIFAWHGSPLHNWHGILREGLHYKDTMHGRAYGNGVYMSPYFVTSLGYTTRNPGGTWPQSKLSISSAISLNEVVNAPTKFESALPHLVVQQLDWIQTRYLFVSCRQGPMKQYGASNQHSPDFYYQQDPKYTATGPTGQPITIPMIVFSRQRRLAMEAALIQSSSGPTGMKIRDGVSGLKEESTASKKARMNVGASQLVDTQEDWISDDTDTEDIIILVKADEHKGKAPIRNSPKAPEIPKTDFIPGKLAGSTLPLLGPPSYATPGATKALQRDLNTTLQIQETTPLHELGWYIDPNLINTVYQWIVELHSFDANLPLADDLKQAELTSIALELRFSKDYPISPPFVRVIRPRFLSFQQGGGGHVTAGGALCMELLTNSGWSAVSSIESVLLQVRLAISSTEPKPARLERGQSATNGTVRDYGVGEAVDAYVRACHVHGWEVPKDFSLYMRGGGWSSKAN
ncbi:protein with ADP-ribose polymerase and ubiquitin-conjugating enzyme catalytic domains [Emydomyces testavorans]|uniref:Protein with ADP-ribose polymerase and ubiquitin-conjugating enzyme catalytic domains n=1 Tax=Emydomyces testavorans TaxID=2070801 RepID=A0AAF0DBG9_9EURO|nr:protein with ADP-ribose polymerase and ubiquitin-conjugating enzyme catalytic domains [Emydomyces testavorans]